MPYNDISELPDQVKTALPQHGQEIYQAAFDSAWKEYKYPSDRKDDSGREATSHKVAWAAVKKEYKKNDRGDWVKNQ